MFPSRSSIDKLKRDQWEDATAGSAMDPWPAYGSPPGASLNGFGSFGSWESARWGGSQASTGWSGGSSRGVSPARPETRAFVDLDDPHPDVLDGDGGGAESKPRLSLDEGSGVKDVKSGLSTLVTSLTADWRALASENTPRVNTASLPTPISLGPVKKPVRTANAAGSGPRHENTHSHLAREHSHLHPSNSAIPRPPSPRANTLLCDAEDVKLRLIRPLGVGAFSCVWLAEDEQGSLAAGGDRRAHSTSEAKRRRDRRMHGLRPSAGNPRANGEKFNGDGGIIETNGTGEKETKKGIGLLAAELARGRDIERTQSPLLIEPSPVSASEPPTSASGRLVAVKMMDRALCDVNDRTRISFVREVEVLRVSMLDLDVHTR